MAYNPNLYMPQGIQSPTFQPTVPPWAQGAVAQPINGLISVTGIEGAKAYQIPPDSKVALFDSNDDVMYVKSTDAGGYPTIRTFRFTPVEAEAAPTPDYVTRDEFRELADRIGSLEDAARPAKASKGAKGGK